MCSKFELHVSQLFHRDDRTFLCKFPKFYKLAYNLLVLLDCKIVHGYTTKLEETVWLPWITFLQSQRQFEKREQMKISKTIGQHSLPFYKFRSSRYNYNIQKKTDRAAHIPVNNFVVKFLIKQNRRIDGSYPIYEKYYQQLQMDLLEEKPTLYNEILSEKLFDLND